MDVDIIAGYLGVGKTTCIIEMIRNDPDPSRLAVLINEFGDVGIDAALIGDDTEVVELASGCICCTLRLDFRTQIMEIAERYRSAAAPDRADRRRHHRSGRRALFGTVTSWRLSVAPA